MSESVKQHPEWQQTFRAAQAERNNQLALEAAIKRDKEAEEARKTGEFLATALMHFGIHLENAPDTNAAVVDDFTFCLSSGAGYSVRKSSEGREWIRFDLRVSKPTIGRYTGDDQIRYKHISVDTSTYDFNKTGWDRYLVMLADAFDDIDADVAFDLEQHAASLKRNEERRLNPPGKSESTEEKLLKLIRSIVRDELANQLEY